MPEDQPAIIVKDLYKSFHLPHEQHNGLKQLIVNFFKRKKGYEVQQVLEDISFEIKKGEFFGIVGRNGSGKSTLLKLLAGIYAPDKGLVQVNGSLTPFIELGVGFNPELTGRENVYMNGALLGFGHEEMDQMYHEIVDFAELRRFMDQKLKNYSSGMQVRLAFSIAIRAKSDILLIDEVLAVGDAAFQSKCFDYFNELKKSNTTVVFVSHDQGSLERFCDRGVLIDKGRKVVFGNIKEVLRSYSQVVLGELDKSSRDDDAVKRKTEFAQIFDVKVLNQAKEKSRRYYYGDKIHIEYNIKIKRNLKNPIFGVTIWQKNVEKAILATNTLIDGEKETGDFQKGDTITYKVRLPSNLNAGEYYVEPAIANDSTTVFYDQQPKAAKFIINGGDNPHSVISFAEKGVFSVERE